MLRAEDLLQSGQQRGELVTGRRGIPRLPGKAGKATAGDQRDAMLGAEDPLVGRHQRGELVTGRRGIPRLPGPVGEAATEARVSGCSVAETRSSPDISAANWSRAATGIPRLPGPMDEACHEPARVSRVLRAADPRQIGQQLPEQPNGLGEITGLSRPGGLRRSAP